ncbi:MAG: family 43 glycosylhydrolase [Candidatus Krumholzibacteriota bacterium]|nr:family 43 glycosylhydrolase [Candidatus Krumholzibacteriota bacterium]
MHQRPRRQSTGILALLLLAALAVAGESARAHVLYDFEQPYFVEEPDVQCKDHAVVKVDGLYHVFYIHSFPPEPGEYLRSEKWLGHLTSPDLKHWTRQDSILPVSEVPGTWEDTFIWAPKIVPDPHGPGWFLFYTGSDEFVCQQTGAAYSIDLSTWYRMPQNPLYHPGSWAAWSEASWANCRDPELFHQASDGYWYLFNTASTAGGFGAISNARSPDLLHWSDLGPLVVNDTEDVLESCQLAFEDGSYHLFFTEQGVQGTSHITSPLLYGGWDMAGVTIIDAGNAPEISRLDDEDLFSRHNAINTSQGPLYYFRFDRIDLSTPDLVPEIISLGGLDERWTIIFGNAFDNQPTWGDNPRERGDPPSHMKGNSYLATYEDFSHPLDGEPGDAQGPMLTGLMRSEGFTVTGDRFRLLVGGGYRPETCFVGLVRDSDGAVLFKDTGINSHSMIPRLWDTSNLLGEAVYLVVADLGWREWDCISVDHIEEYDRSGQDPFPPDTPLDPPPLLDDILEAAGFVLTGAGSAPAPGAARLLAPHPNPFNPRTRLRYELVRAGRAELVVLDARGRAVRRLFAGDLPAGPGFFTWDGRDDAGRSLPSGVYLARLSLDGRPAPARRLVLVR